MMITVNRIGDSITGFYNGKPFGVSYSDQKYAQMKELEYKATQVASMEDLKSLLEEFKPMTVESYKELVEHAQGGQFLYVNNHTGKIYLAINGKVSSKALPQSIVDRIITSVEKKIDVLPLVKCWARLLRNPNYTDAKAKKFAEYINTTFLNKRLAAELMDTHGLNMYVANQRATIYDVAITQEGLLNTYKVSKEIDWKYVADENAEDGVRKTGRYAYEVDEITGLKTYKQPDTVEERVFEPAVMGQGYDAFFCGEKEGHVIRVGFAHYLDTWDKVNCNDSASCVKGLHVGGLRYIEHYQNEGTVTHNVFVDPMDIGAITDDGTGALRVRRYFVHSSFAGANANIYHSSSYAKLTDMEYADMFTKAVEEHQQKLDAHAEELDEKRNLL
jgi:hypothetical protein